jgi:predicted nucleotidyltransferase component of viral defense system
VSHMDWGHFPPEIQEKIERLFDILSRLYSVPFLSKRLALHGGNCLNFVHLERSHRLSLDLDLNFMDIGTGNWRDERERVDDILKKIFSDLGYKHDDIRIQANYPLTDSRCDTKPHPAGKIRSRSK